MNTKIAEAFFDQLTKTAIAPLAAALPAIGRIAGQTALQLGAGKLMSSMMKPKAPKLPQPVSGLDVGAPPRPLYG